MIISDNNLFLLIVYKQIHIAFEIDLMDLFSQLCYSRDNKPLQELYTTPKGKHDHCILEMNQNLETSYMIMEIVVCFFQNVQHSSGTILHNAWLILGILQIKFVY